MQNNTKEIQRILNTKKFNSADLIMISTSLRSLQMAFYFDPCYGFVVHKIKTNVVSIDNQGSNHESCTIR